MTATSPTLTNAEQLVALRTRAGVMPLWEMHWIAVTGEDRVRWLNGMMTNSVQALTPGEGAYGFFLSAQGRIQGDAAVWAEPDRLLLETGAAQSERLIELLDRFIIMDDVELRALDTAEHGLLVAGPGAAELLEATGLAVKGTEPMRRSTVDWRGKRIDFVHAYSPSVPRFELWPPDAQIARQMQEALVAAGAAECGEEAFELLRIFEGTPKYGVDIREKDLAQETAQTRALHFNKGCYLGQEIVERIRSRGAVHRTFTSFVVRGPVPPAGTVIEAEGRKAGELTSVAAEEIDGERLALGFIRLEVLERGLPITYEGGTVEARGAVAAS